MKTPLQPGRLPLPAGLGLDGRRAVWLERERVLVAADLHLGYPWVQRQRGLLLPVTTPDDTVPRLQALIADYQPRAVVILGDLVHRGVSLPALEAELRRMVEPPAGTAACRWILVAGNHDRGLEPLLRGWDLPIEVMDTLELGAHLLVHGDALHPGVVSWLSRQNGTLVFGHEHPALTMRGRGARAAKCPCFLLAPRRLLLPAFSRWAAGTEVGSRPWSSPWARGVAWDRAVVIMGERLLSRPWPPQPRSEPRP